MKNFSHFKKVIPIFTTNLKNYLPGILISFFIVAVVCVVANLLYTPKKFVKRGYEVDIAAVGKPQIKQEVDFPTLFANADALKGEKIFKKCASCHNIAANAGAKVGPNLYGVFGRKVASQNFSYSESMKAKGGSWNVEDLNNFIKKPKDAVPGTKMSFAGLKNDKDRADLIKYLQEVAKK